MALCHSVKNLTVSSSGVKISFGNFGSKFETGARTFSWTFSTFEGETKLCRNIGYHLPSGRGVALITHHVVPRLKKEYRYTSTLLGFNGFF